MEKRFTGCREVMNSLMLTRTVVLLLSLACFWSPAAPGDSTARSLPSFAGEWTTTYGPMSLRQTGDGIEGTYGPPSHRSTIQGRMNGKRFTFRYVEPDATGEGWFELDIGGDRFLGQWRETGDPEWSGWTGIRLAAQIPTNFTGLWDTSYGRMRLQQTGTNAQGIYNHGGSGRIQGHVSRGEFQFQYDQANGEKGTGAFRLTPDAAAFEGTWAATTKASAKDAPGGSWAGRRVLPQPDRIWLVVLEANWESGLEQNEYAFGHMLRSYFARVPRVEVRHRFFGHEDEFKRWCAELPYLAEPVILHISSHGTEEGITCGGKPIGARIIADALRPADNLRLLHFGSCLIGAGGIPGQIHELLGAHATFPISGYTRTADWGGSAVVDFTFLDLIFSHRLSPAEAVAKTRQMISFARDQGERGAPIAPAGLVIFEPRKTAQKAERTPK